MRIFLCLLVFGTPACVAQDNPFSKFGITAGVSQSLNDGDEQYYTGLNFGLFRRFHLGAYIGLRPPDPRTYNLSASIEYDLWSNTHHRVALNNFVGFFARYDSYLFDEYYWKHSIGLGYDYLIGNRISVGADYNLIGLYYGTRRDNFVTKPRTPGIFHGGDLRLNLTWFL